MAARRQQILDAARARFEIDGFARTSMPDIVAESGLSNGTLYHYFPSKDDLVLAVCQSAFAQVTDELAQGALTRQAIVGMLDRIRLLAVARGHPKLVAQIWGEAAVSPALARQVQDQLAEQRQTVARLIDGGQPTNARSAAAAEAFLALCSGYVLQLAVRDDVPLEPFVEALLLITSGAGSDAAVDPRARPPA
jgi:AcrR family transcriptional regulator